MEVDAMKSDITYCIHKCDEDCEFNMIYAEEGNHYSFSDRYGTSDCILFQDHEDSGDLDDE